MERRAVAGDIRALVSSELERRGFLAAFMERTGGTSEGPYSSLNLGSEVGDAPDAVRENRSRVAAALGIGELISARQVHGKDVLRVTSSDAAKAEADVLTTTERSRPLAVMTADCVPVVLASEVEATLAAVHVGWRGLAAGIVQQGMNLFRDGRHVVAAIGPAIGPCHYEVGAEVIEALRTQAGGGVVARPSAARFMLDLGATVEGLIRGAGVTVVERADACTACDPDRFFSHRRDGITGRQALVAVRL